jgi:hypothetical protein
MRSLNKLKAILSGLTNFYFPTKAIEKIAKDRAVICSKCEHANPEHPFKLLLEDNSTQEIKGMGCNICHCLLSAKVRQLLEPCPLKKWT